LDWVDGMSRNEFGESKEERRAAWRALAAALALAVVFGLPANAGAVGAADEYGLKAAFLYQFTKYVSWPGEADGPIAICVLGDDPFGSILDETLAGKTAKGQPIEARRVGSARAGSACQILFVSRSERANLADTLAALGGHPTLTVGDMTDFPRRGGMINLRLDEDRIKLEVNPDNAERAGLKIRSELLRLADVVRN
jgi:hypothetical protein